MSQNTNEEMEDMVSDSDIEMAFNNEENECQKRKSSREFKYEVLDIKQIVKQMEENIEQIRNVIDLPTPVIRTLLKHFHWDTQKLLEQIFDPNRDQLFKSIGIVVPEEKTRKGLRTNSRRKPIGKTEINCQICLLNVKSVDTFGLDCGHIYCIQCWRQYLSTKIISEGNVMTITCAQNGCKVIIDDDQVLHIIEDPKVRSKYQRLTTDSYVESNRLLRWCPKPDCLHAFSVRSSDSHPVICVCGTQICFGCGQQNHEPIGCHLLREWNKESAGNNSEKIDGKTANWIITNTKECPKCRTSIEKNGGCNHMICRSIKCKYEFCWVCLDSWSTHGTNYYKCNLYNEDKVKDKQSDQRKTLERFMFYWTRFMNHKQSLMFENELKSTVNSKMTKMQNQFGMAWVEVQFMEAAIDVLCSCRQTLMYTYVFAYFSERTQQLNIFEDNQRDLQKAVEQLSEYLEKDFDAKEDRSFRLKVIHSTNYCEKRREVLIDHIKEGNESECWKYNIK